MIFSDALAIAEEVKRALAPYCTRIEIAGSIRRRRPEVKDIEIVCVRKSQTLADFVYAVKKWKRLKGHPTGKYTQRLLPQGINLDLFMAGGLNWGLIFGIRTGSAEFSHLVLANGWVRAGYESIDGHLTKNGTIVPVPEEEELFRLIGVPWTEPEQREI